MNKIYFTVLLTAILLVQACKPKADNLLDKYNRGQMLNDIYSSAIWPLHVNFEAEAINLDAAAQIFLTTPNMPNLLALQQQWITTQRTWQTCEPINVGDVREMFIGVYINTWPANINSIENVIVGSNTIDEAFIHDKGANSKGLPALEYLIFGDNNATVLQQLMNNPRRMQYAAAVAKDLSTMATQLKNQWSSYRPAFVSSTGLAIDGSVNMLVNALIEYEEFIKNDKVGAPLGKKTNNIVQPTAVESARSNTSIAHIENNLNSIDALLNGTIAGSGGNGLYTYLDAVDPTPDGTMLSTKIRAQMILCRNATSSIAGPLEDAVINNPAQVDALYLELRKLTVLLKVDLTSILGVTVTFTDNDGD